MHVRVARVHDPAQHAAGRRVSQSSELGTRHECCAHRGVQLCTAAAQVTLPASVVRHDDSSSADPPQQDFGEHTVHEHIRL
jgi:hypothetical protein